MQHYQSRPDSDFGNLARQGTTGAAIATSEEYKKRSGTPLKESTILTFQRLSGNRATSCNLESLSHGKGTTLNGSSKENIRQVQRQFTTNIVGNGNEDIALKVFAAIQAGDLFPGMKQKHSEVAIQKAILKMLTSDESIGHFDFTKWGVTNRFLRTLENNLKPPEPSSRNEDLNIEPENDSAAECVQSLEAGEDPVHLMKPVSGYGKMFTTGLISCVFVIIEARSNGLVNAASGFHFIPSDYICPKTGIITIKGEKKIADEAEEMRAFGDISAILMRAKGLDGANNLSGDEKTADHAIDTIASILRDKCAAPARTDIGGSTRTYRLYSNGRSYLDYLGGFE